MRAVSLLLLTGCSAGIYTDFALVDENPVSPTAGQEIGPSTERGHVSAWYFGHST